MASEKHTFDVIVLGGGPGGYPAAIRAAQNGASVALIEAKELGGTCLNRGCIPSKALIASAEEWQHVQEASHFGIQVKGASFDYSSMVERKDKIVTNLRNNLDALIASNQITLVRGFGQFTSPNEIKVTGQTKALYTAPKIIIATGSEPKNLPIFQVDGKKIHDSTSLLNLKKIPNSILIIGGGIIGCEFASLYALLGVKVTILELMSRLIPMEDKSVSDALTKAFIKKGVTIHTGVQIASLENTSKGTIAKLSSGQSHEADITLVSVGRSLNTNNIGLEKAGVVTRENGSIPVNDKMETSAPGIYAIGDIASKWLLAHVATHQGIVAASNATGYPARMHYNAVPSVIYTHPEIATVGLSLEDANAQGYAAAIGAFPFQALGKAQAAYHTDGFAQIVTDKKTGEILGAQVVGHEASTLIAEMAVAIENELTIDSITQTIHAHPTNAEAWLEAALVASEMPIHLPPKKKVRKTNG